MKIIYTHAHKASPRLRAADRARIGVLLVVLLCLALGLGGCSLLGSTGPGTQADPTGTPSGGPGESDKEQAQTPGDSTDPGAGEEGQSGIGNEIGGDDQDGQIGQGNPDEPNGSDQQGNPGGSATGSNPGSTTRPAGPATTDVRTEDDGNLFVLVNKTYAVSEDYTPTDMVAVDGALSTNQGLTVKREAYDAYLTMLEDARNAGLDFYICSAYRSYATQKSLYDNSLAVNGQAYTETMFAYPGKSEHHTGYAIDITSASMGWSLQQNFADYPDGAWITEHCSEYGFIIRYPRGKEDITGYVYEPWHIRYVGVEAAQEITEAGITLEEYLGVA